MQIKLIIILLIVPAIFAVPIQLESNDTQSGPEKTPEKLLFCKSGQYACKKKGTSIFEINVCISLSDICNDKVDCPLGEDEDEKRCQDENFIGNLTDLIQNRPTDNDFSGTGFMLSIDNLFVSENAKLKMFNQESDNQQSLGDIDH